jgi:hypothetical protein
MQQGARSSVVNGPFTGTKERRSFKPKVASSILVGRMGKRSLEPSLYAKSGFFVVGLASGQRGSTKVSGQESAFFRPLLPFTSLWDHDRDEARLLSRAMGADYLRILDHALGAMLQVEFATEGREVTDYAVVLLLEVGNAIETIRVYDGAHGYNEMHRYTRSEGKQAGAPFNSGTLGEGMRAAIEEIEGGYRKMIEGWEKQ